VRTAGVTVSAEGEDQIGVGGDVLQAVEAGLAATLGPTEGEVGPSTGLLIGPEGRQQVRVGGNVFQRAEGNVL